MRGLLAALSKKVLMKEIDTKGCASRMEHGALEGVNGNGHFLVLNQEEDASSYCTGGRRDRL